MYLCYFCILFAVILWYGGFRYKRRNMYLLAKKVKTPKLLFPFFGISIEVLGNTEAIMNKMKYYSDFATSSGGVACGWLGPLLYYLITDADKIEVVLKTVLEKDGLHRFIQVLVGNASIFSKVSIWRPRRKITVTAFSPKILSEFVNVFSLQSDKLSNKLKPMAGAGNFKLWPYVNAYSLDAIMETAMGVQINAQDSQDNPILTAVNESLRLSSERIFHLWLQPDWLFKFFPQYSQLLNHTRIVHDFTSEIIRKKKTEFNTKNKDIAHKPDVEQGNLETTFLDHLIRQSDLQGGYSDLELREEVLTFIIAAMDTSATTMGFVLKLLGKYPEIQQKVFKELDAVFEGSDRLLYKHDLAKLQYLERVIKETLRLFPSVPFLIRKAEYDTQLTEDITLPKGAGIVCSIWGVHRNPTIWGPDADCFDPDRFLPERCKDLPACAYIPFSFGPRNCLGYQYAMMSMKTALSTVLRVYRVVGAPEAGPIPNIRVKLEVMLKAVDEYEVAIVER
ncbi:cytochrome P450 4C1-like isoform X1 [Pieris brassicae]|nr:cytochrome P450 4C1-like isoform X1 [Pieris brassicae]